MTDRSQNGAPQDRYVVQEYLSEGGMGAIYIGKKLGAGGFSKAVVLKQLLPEFTSQREFRELFLREARLSATLDHANIVHTIDLVNADDEFFMVMEYVPGADLRTMLKKAKRRHRRFSPAAGIYVTRELLSALGYAHGKRSPEGQELNLIHRDVSPSNILVSLNGEVKLTDFGIAKASTHNSNLYRVKGKIGYMSPEQAKGEPMDHRSDLYSLAVCLFEMVAGERLFVKAGLSTSAEEMYGRPVPLLSRTIEGVPPEFDKVMLRALHVDPRERYQTASAFQDALLRCAHRAGLLMSTPELSAHLREVCGPPERWREDDEGGAAPDPGTNRPGTEVYEPVGGTEPLGPGEYPDASGAQPGRRSHRDMADVIDDRERREERSRSSMFHLDRLRNVELTSLIDLSRQRPDNAPKRRPSGSRPLVDVGDLGRPPDRGAQGFQSMDPRAVPVVGHPAAYEDPVIRPLEHELEPSATANVPAPAWAPPPMAYSQGPSNYSDTYGATAMARALSPRRRRVSGRMLLVLLIVIVIVGIGAAVLIGLSGPKMGGEGSPATDQESSGGAPTGAGTEPDTLRRTATDPGAVAAPRDP